MAERFAEHGAKVMLVGRKQEKLDAAQSAILSSGGTASTASVDVRDYPAVEAALQKTRDQFGEIDILVCGAAGNFPAPVLGMSANGCAFAQTRRNHHQHFGVPCINADCESIACLRR
jgi:NADP-dependent 3-hydroxy acid dehydrogenase YdfG